MSVVRCLCCEHVNALGDKFCVACGSTLNLKLCKQCEAVNESSAQRCHNCGTALAALSMADELGALEAAVTTDLRMPEAPFAARLPLQAFSSIGQRSAPWRIRSSQAVLLVLLLALMAGFMYYRYGEPLFRSASREANPGGVPAVAATSGSGNILTTETATSPAASPLKPGVTHTGRVAAAPAAVATSSKELRSSRVAADAAVEARAAEATTAAPAPAPMVNPAKPRVTHTAGVAASPVAAAAVVEARAAEATTAAPASEPVVAPAKQRVTHTAGVAAPPVVTESKEAPAVVSASTDAPAAVAPQAQPAQPGADACTEAKAALGFCTPSAK